MLDRAGGHLKISCSINPRSTQLHVWAQGVRWIDRRQTKYNGSLQHILNSSFIIIEVLGRQCLHNNSTQYTMYNAHNVPRLTLDTRCPMHLLYWTPTTQSFLGLLLACTDSCNWRWIMIPEPTCYQGNAHTGIAFQLSPSPFPHQLEKITIVHSRLKSSWGWGKGERRGGGDAHRGGLRFWKRFA